MPPSPADLNRSLAAVQKLFDKQDWKGALPLLDQMARALPRSPAVHSLRASALRQMGRLGDALLAIQTALNLDPGNLKFQHSYGNILKDCGRLDEAIEMLGKTAAAKRDDLGVASDWLFAMNYSSTLSPEDLFRAHRAFGEKLEASFPLGKSRASAQPKSGLLTVGFVSGDYCRHSISYFLLPLLRNLDRTTVRTIAYSCSSYKDKTTEEFQQLFDRWLECSPLNDRQLAEKIEGDGVDILFDLAGCTGGNRLGVFARGVAPVQVAWLGYPNSTGLSRMTHRIVDSVTDPEGGAESLHTERLARLPGCFLCYQGVRIEKVPEADEGRPFTFGSFNNFAKLSPATLEAWVQILRQAPSSRLLLKSTPLADDQVQRRTKAFFKERGIDETRVVCFGRIDSELGHLGAYGYVDLALDCFPYNGTTTTCEALWMGVPVLTFLGNRHAARVSASLLTAAGLSDWIAPDVASYISRAAAYGRREKKTPLRSALRSQVTASALCDAERYAKGFIELLKALRT